MLTGDIEGRCTKQLKQRLFKSQEYSPWYALLQTLLFDDDVWCRTEKPGAVRWVLPQGLGSTCIAKNCQ